MDLKSLPPNIYENNYGLQQLRMPLYGLGTTNYYSAKANPHNATSIDEELLLLLEY